MKMLDKLKNYAKYYENEVRDISNQLRELSRELFDEYEITGNRLRYEEGYFKRREFLSTFGLASVIWHKKEDIEKLGHQARLLFDDELKNTQTDEEFMMALKEDISIYRNNDARISSFSLQSANETKYTTFNNREYASLQLVYYIREGSNLRTSGTKFTLRKDNSGKWKILYWELVDSVDLS